MRRRARLVDLVCLVCLVDLVHLVSFVQPKNQTDQIDQTNLITVLLRWRTYSASCYGFELRGMLDVLARLDRDGRAGDIEDGYARNQALLGGRDFEITLDTVD